MFNYHPKTTKRGAPLPWRGLRGGLFVEPKNDISTGADTAKAVTTDANDNIYISGSFSNGSNQDIKTIKYSPAGIQQWAIDYNGQANGEEYVLDMTLDEGDVLVSAQTWSGSSYKYAAIRYSELEYTDLSFSSSEDVNPYAFVKNNGQLRDSAGSGHPEVKYMSKYGRSLSFYKDDGFDWMVRSYHNDSTVNDTVHKVAFDFVNPTSEVRVRPYQKADYFENHYIPHGMQKYERLPVYGKLLYSEVWNDIDLETCLTGDKELRFTVNKGGDVSDIKIAQTGADSIVKNNDGTIGVHFFNGEIVIPRVRAYQRNSNDDLVELSWQPALVKTGSIISLDSIGSYNTNKSLILRIAKAGGDIPETPGFCHSTYFGSVSVDRVFGSTLDDQGNPAICGVSANTSVFEDENGIVVINTSGPYTGQCFIQKFDPDFTPLYISILNANGPIVLSAITHDNGSYFSVGNTGANNMFTANFLSADYFDDENIIGNKGIILAFDENSGVLNYSSHFGAESNNSTGWSEGNSIYDLGFDDSNNLYIVGQAVMSPNTDFPLTSMGSAYYEDTNTGITGFVAKFDQNLSLDWCTQFGENESGIASLDVNDDGLLAVTGWYEGSSSFIPTISNTVQELSVGGNSDWFAAVFGTDGSLEWGSFEGSNDDEEEIGALLSRPRVSFGSDNGLFFAANLKSVSGITFQNFGGAYFNNTNSGISPTGVNNYAMIVKYRVGSYDVVWRSLLLNGERENRITDLTRVAGNVYVSGYTSDETMDLEQESGAVFSSGATTNYPNFSQAEDGYFMKFSESNYGLIHSSYFGGESYDAINTISVNQDSELFAFGRTRSFYNDDQAGIPVLNNDISGTWYQENHINAGIADDIFGFKLCSDLLLENNNEIDTDNKIIVYPNPNRGNVISIGNLKDCDRIKEVNIYDISGKLVASPKEIKLNGNSNDYRFRIHKSLDSGSYIVQLSGCEGTLQSKFIVLR